MTFTEELPSLCFTGYLSPHRHLQKAQETGGLKGEETRTLRFPISPKISSPDSLCVINPSQTGCHAGTVPGGDLVSLSHFIDEERKRGARCYHLGLLMLIAVTEAQDISLHGVFGGFWEALFLQLETILGISLLLIGVVRATPILILNLLPSTTFYCPSSFDMKIPQGQILDWFSYPLWCWLE